MRLAVLADIHANLEALEAVLAHLDGQRIDQIVCLGDVIGYNASPAECVRHMMARKVPTIRGNHERMVLGTREDSVRHETQDAVEYTQEALSVEELKWVEALPDQLIHESEYLLVHGSPREKDEYMNSAEKYAANLKKMRNTYGGLEICFFGHTHFPVVVSKDKIEEKIHEDRTIALKKREIYLVNPGSIGQPRDSCPKASYLVYDSEAHAVHIFRLPYDIDLAKKRIKTAGLDPKLAARLTYGK